MWKQNKVDNTAFKPTLQQLRSKAFAWLGRQELSVAQLTEKLKNYGGEPAQIKLLLDEFIEKKYVDNQRFSSLLLRKHVRLGKGPLRFEHELEKHDIAVRPQQIKQQDWLQLAIDVRIKKYGEQLPDNAKQKAKQLRFLQYRGFPIGIALQALKQNESE